MIVLLLSGLVVIFMFFQKTNQKGRTCRCEPPRSTSFDETNPISVENYLGRFLNKNAKNIKKVQKIASATKERASHAPFAGNFLYFFHMFGPFFKKMAQVSFHTNKSVWARWIFGTFLILFCKTQSTRSWNLARDSANSLLLSSERINGQRAKTSRKNYMRARSTPTRLEKGY